ncbi:MAG: hypothetical protein QM820_04655 [Minicystis sp.]
MLVLVLVCGLGCGGEVRTAPAGVPLPVAPAWPLRTFGTGVFWLAMAGAGTDGHGPTNDVRALHKLLDHLGVPRGRRAYVFPYSTTDPAYCDAERGPYCFFRTRDSIVEHHFLAKGEEVHRRAVLSEYDHVEDTFLQQDNLLQQGPLASSYGRPYPGGQIRTVFMMMATHGIPDGDGLRLQWGESYLTRRDLDGLLDDVQGWFGGDVGKNVVGFLSACYSGKAIPNLDDDWSRPYLIASAEPLEQDPVIAVQSNRATIDALSKCVIDTGKPEDEQRRALLRSHLVHLAIPPELGISRGTLGLLLGLQAGAQGDLSVDRTIYPTHLRRVIGDFVDRHKSGAPERCPENTKGLPATAGSLGSLATLMPTGLGVRATTKSLDTQQLETVFGEFRLEMEKRVWPTIVRCAASNAGPHCDPPDWECGFEKVPGSDQKLSVRCKRPSALNTSSPDKIVSDDLAIVSSPSGLQLAPNAAQSFLARLRRTTFGLAPPGTVPRLHWALLVDTGAFTTFRDKTVDLRLKVVQELARRVATGAFGDVLLTAFANRADTCVLGRLPPASPKDPIPECPTDEQGLKDWLSPMRHGQSDESDLGAGLTEVLQKAKAKGWAATDTFITYVGSGNNGGRTLDLRDIAKSAGLWGAPIWVLHLIDSTAKDNHHATINDLLGSLGTSAWQVDELDFKTDTISRLPVKLSELSAVVDRAMSTVVDQSKNVLIEIPNPQSKPDHQLVTGTSKSYIAPPPPETRFVYRHVYRSTGIRVTLRGRTNARGASYARAAFSHPPSQGYPLECKFLTDKGDQPLLTPSGEPSVLKVDYVDGAIRMQLPRDVPAGTMEFYIQDAEKLVSP